MIFKVLLDKIAAFIFEIIVDSVVYKAKKAKLTNYQIVKVSIKDGVLALESKTLSSKFTLEDRSIIFARTAIGQNTLMLFSPYSLIENPITYILVPKFSMWCVGFRRFRKFINDWKGQSLFGEIEVIKYKTLWDF